MSNENIKPLVLHVAIALEALHIPYEVKLWDFGDAPNGVKGPAFLKINENGRVPAVEDPNTDVVSWESAACVSYLLRVYDKQNALGPRGKSEQDYVDFDKWIAFLISSLGPMMGQTNWYRHYSAEKNDEALERYVAQSYRTFDVLEGQLAKSGGDSILPGGFSAVDVHFYPWVNQYGYAQLSLDEYPKIKAWLEKVGNRPEVQAAYEKIPKGQHA